VLLDEIYFIRDGAMRKGKLSKCGTGKLTHQRIIRDDVMERNLWSKHALLYVPHFFATITSVYPYTRHSLEKKLHALMQDWVNDKRITGHASWVGAGEEQPRRVADKDTSAYHIHLVGWLQHPVDSDGFVEIRKAFYDNWNHGISEFTRYEKDGGAMFYTLGHPNHIEGIACKRRGRCRRAHKCVHRHDWEQEYRIGT